MWTDYFIKRKIRKLAKGTALRFHRFCPLDKADDILVFLEMKDRKQIQPCLDTLQKLRKRVKVCMFVPRNTRPEHRFSGLSVCETKDINRWGFPANHIVSPVTTLKADILIDLTGMDCHSMKYMMLQHPSTFKTGLKWEEAQDMYDFSITMTNSDNVKHLFEQILFYLQTIRSK
jgi:hypothetical protein